MFALGRRQWWKGCRAPCPSSVPQRAYEHVRAQYHGVRSGCMFRSAPNPLCVCVTVCLSVCVCATLRPSLSGEPSPRSASHTNAWS
eukprot:761643-Rhodomonas_salina.2